MTEMERLIKATDDAVMALVVCYGFKAVAAIMGSVASLSVANGREAIFRDALTSMPELLDELAAKHRRSKN